MANTNDMNTPTKVPCGGFVLGEGLALSKDGKTLNVTGGGSQADWNQNDETAPDYIKNRPFGIEYGKEVVNEYILESTGQDSDGKYIFSRELSNPDNVRNLMGPFNINLDGTTYENVQFVISEGNAMRKYIFQTDGLPFSLNIQWYADYPSTIRLTYSDNDYIGLIQIYDKGSQIIKPLDSKYLDIDYLSKNYFPLCQTQSYHMEGGESIVYNSQRKRFEPSYDVILKSSTSGSNKKFKITVDDSGAITATATT